MNEVRPGSPRWAELVESGREAVARVDESVTERNWRLGDAALEIAPMGDGTVNNGALAALEQYADEVGVGAESLRAYRRVAGAWAHGTRVPCAGWKVHQILARDDRQRLVRAGMTVTEAHQAAEQSVVGRTGPRSSPEQRARQTLDNLADPETLAYLDRMAKTPVEELNLQAVANGGRVPERAERERDVLDVIRDAADDEQLAHHLFDELDQLLVQLAKIGPFGEDTPLAARSRAAQLVLLDLIAVGVRK